MSTPIPQGDRHDTDFVESRLLGMVRLMRPRQWVKNAFVFAPIFFTPSAVSMKALVATLLLFLSFCLVSSGVYCFNDLRDRQSDKRHPIKCRRPLASGLLGPATGLAMAIGLVVTGLLIAILTSPAAATVVLAYAALNLGYSLGLKSISIVDVLIISAGFVLRVHAGAAVIAVEPTAWIQICAGMLALFIALAKRRDDLAMDLDSEHRVSLAGYTKPFLDVCVVVTLSALLVSYLIFTADQDAMVRLGSEKLYLTTPYVIAGVFRYLQLTLVEERSGSPTSLLFDDPFLMVTVAAWLATYIYMIHF